MSSQSLATKAIHADHRLAGAEVSANISVSTTFKHPDPEEVASKPEGFYDTAWQANEPSRDIYSREGQPTLTRAEKVLEGVIGHPTLVYPSGLNAFFSLLLWVNPDVVAIGTREGPGYHGCHGALDVYLKTRKLDKSTAKIFIDDEFPTDGRRVLCWIETPLNPTGESYSIEYYARKIHAVPGGVLGVDSTFAPPPLQDPFRHGADIVMHSGTKYFAGHSDTLIGTLSVRTTAEWMELWSDRTYTGGVPGSLDAWLLLRSLRTLNVRIERQTKTATHLARWLNSLTAANYANSNEEAGNGTEGKVLKVYHTSLQADADDLLAEDGSKQMTRGPACFAILLEKEIHAEYLPSRLQLFFNATSLGGVESLIEQRKISDPSCDPRLLRLSIGLEDLEDLKEDIRQAFRKVAEAPPSLKLTHFASTCQDRRPLTPPLIVKLECTRDGTPLANSEFDATRFVLAADLRAADSLADANVVPSALGGRSHSSQRRGSRASSSAASPGTASDNPSRTPPPPPPPAATSSSTATASGLVSFDSEDRDPSSGVSLDTPMPTEYSPDDPGPPRKRRRPSTDGTDATLADPLQASPIARGFVSTSRHDDDDVTSVDELEPAVPNLIGTLHANSYTLCDPDSDSKGTYFVLPDLSVRTEGRFRLRLRLVSIDFSNGSDVGTLSPIVTSAYSDEFQVYSAKKFPGML
ncbi:hypothetical protein JCM11491_003902, partial [Sporobolomyces phaffii]